LPPLALSVGGKKRKETKTEKLLWGGALDQLLGSPKGQGDQRPKAFEREWTTKKKKKKKKSVIGGKNATLEHQPTRKPRLKTKLGGEISQAGTGATRLANAPKIKEGKPGNFTGEGRRADNRAHPYGKGENQRL